MNFHGMKMFVDEDVTRVNNYVHVVQMCIHIMCRIFAQ